MDSVMAYCPMPFDPSAYPPYPIPGGFPGGFPGGIPAGAMQFFPGTPTSSTMQFPDTTVKSGSEFGDTPPSSGSSSNMPKRKFKSPEEEKRYRQKRARNNEAAKKSRRSRKEKEHGLLEENTLLKRQIEDLRRQYDQILMRKDQEIAHLQTIISSNQAASFQSNSENIDPARLVDSKTVFQMFGSSVNLNTQ